MADTVTVRELNTRIERRCAENPAFARNTALLLKELGEWRKWPLHLQKDLFAKLDVEAVLMPLGPGGVHVGDADGVHSAPAPFKACSLCGHPNLCDRHPHWRHCPSGYDPNGVEGPKNG